jgi:hypothetical protein
MFQPPQAFKELFQEFGPVFRRRTGVRMMWLVLGILLLRGRRTFTRILALLSGLVEGHYSTFYRIFSRPHWSSRHASRILARLVIEAAPPDERIVALVDTTVSEHPGRCVYGKGKHRDAVRSSHSFTAWRWGHKRVVLAIAVPIPLVSRRWALPVMSALYRTPEVNRAEGRRHKKPAQLARQMMRVLLAWFPEKAFVLVGDGDFSSHETARWARRYQRQLTFVGRFYANAGLYDPPPAYSGQGRPRVKGDKRPMPAEVTGTAQRYKTQVNWYGGQRRKVSLVSSQGLWYKGGCGLVEVRWVYVEDRQGTHRPDYFFSTDPTMSQTQIVEYYTLRWSIETTFQEVRAHLGFETTRHWSPPAVERVEPCLLALFSLVSLLYIRHLKRRRRPQLSQWRWYRKEHATFADALTLVRRQIWVESVFTHPLFATAVKKLPPQVCDKLVDYLTQAA